MSELSVSHCGERRKREQGSQSSFDDSQSELRDSRQTKRSKLKEFNVSYA